MSIETIFEELTSVKGSNTSMITMIIKHTPNALGEAIKTLKYELSMSANIKSRI